MNTLPTNKTELIQSIASFPTLLAEKTRTLVETECSLETLRANLRLAESQANIKARSTLAKPTVDAVDAAVATDPTVVDLRQKITNSDIIRQQQRAELEITQSTYKCMELIAKLLV